jgi:hypothetical protein
MGELFCHRFAHSERMLYQIAFFAFCSMCVFKFASGQLSLVTPVGTELAKIHQFTENIIISRKSFPPFLFRKRGILKGAHRPNISIW